MVALAPPTIPRAGRTLLIADLFCGAGGFSKGMARAMRELGYDFVLTCVNHWPVAIATHKKNHPYARHYCMDLDAARPRELVPEGYLDLLLASPECIFHSRARGGKPINDQRRMSAWHVQRWATELHVQRILVENVPEFQEWGPICTMRNGHRGEHREQFPPAPEGERCNRVVKARKREYFQAWVEALMKLGYDVQWKVVNAADHGDATTRRRLFLEARKDTRPIRWPEAAYAPRAVLQKRALFETRQPWVPGRKVLDLDKPGSSLLTRKKPLSLKTRLRIARGMLRFERELAAAYIRLLRLPDEDERRFLDEARRLAEAGGWTERVPVPFVVANRTNNVPQSTDQPVPVATTAHGGGSMLVTPQLFALGQQSGSAPRSVEEPLPTIAGAGYVRVIQPQIVPDYSGTDASVPVDSPLPTVATHARFGLATPTMMAVPYGPKAEARSGDEPLPTILAKDRLGLATATVQPFVATQHSFGWQDLDGRASGCPARTVEEPLYAATASSKPYLVQPTAEPFLVPYRGERDGQQPRVHSIDEPLPTACAGAKGAALMQPVVVRVTQPEGGDPAGSHVRSVDEPLFTQYAKRDLGIATPVPAEAPQVIDLNGVDPRQLWWVDGVLCVLDILYRMLFNRELARAMSLDDEEAEYEFTGTATDITRQIGNAVPAKTAKALVLAMFDDDATHQKGAVA